MYIIIILHTWFFNAKAIPSKQTNGDQLMWLAYKATKVLFFIWFRYILGRQAGRHWACDSCCLFLHTRKINSQLVPVCLHECSTVHAIYCTVLLPVLVWMCLDMHTELVVPLFPSPLLLLTLITLTLLELLLSSCSISKLPERTVYQNRPSSPGRNT